MHRNLVLILCISCSISAAPVDLPTAIAAVKTAGAPLVAAAEEKLRAASTEPLPDEPLAQFKAIATRFPEITTDSEGIPIRFTNPAADVKKSDSALFPLTGSIDFTELAPTFIDGKEIHIALRLEFQWDGKKWNFAKLSNRENRRDLTDMHGGKSLLEHGLLKSFLAPFR